MKIKLYSTEREHYKKEALRLAQEKTEQSNRTFVVRDDGQRFSVLPEGPKYDMFGKLVQS